MYRKGKPPQDIHCAVKKCTLFIEEMFMIKLGVIPNKGHHMI